MKNAKKIIAVICALVLVFSLATVAFADAKPGKITITNTATDVSYKIYKVFDATYDGTGAVAYTTADTTTDWSTLKIEGTSTAAANMVGTYFKKDDLGNVTIQTAALTSGKLNEKGLKALKKLLPASATDTKTGNGATIVFDNLDAGYYYVETAEASSAVTLTTAAPTTTIIDKNERRPGGDPDDQYKYIVDASGTKVKSAVAAINDTIKFDITFNAVNFDTAEDETTGEVVSRQISQYIITDIPTGIKISWADLVVKVGSKTLTKGNEYTLSGNVITIPWANATTKATIYKSPSVITITYSGVVTAASGVNNDASLQFKWFDDDDNDQNGPESFPPADPENPPSGEPKTTVTSYTAKIENIAKKANPADPAVYLSGAVYELLDKDGNALALVKTADGKYRLATDEEKAAQGFTSAPIELKDGKAEVAGLGNYKYKLRQTTNTPGYNKADDEEFTIANADKTITVENVKGTALPETGAKGTTIFLAIGALLAIVAGVFLVTNKRMSKEAI